MPQWSGEWYCNTKQSYSPCNFHLVTSIQRRRKEGRGEPREVFDFFFLGGGGILYMFYISCSGRDQNNNRTFLFEIT